MVFGYYLVIFILSIVCCVIFYWKMRANFSVLYLLIYVLAFTSHFGYLAIAMSQNVREALLANKILYVGGCFLPLVGLLLVFSICKIYLPKWIRFLMVLFSSFIYACVLTSGYLPIFYKSLDIETRNGVTVLIKEYGPLHILFYIEIGIYLVITIFVLIWGWVKKPNVSKRNLAICAFMQIFSIFAFFVGRSVTKEIEWMALADLVDEIGFLIIMSRIVLYRVDDLVSSSLLKEGEYGYIALDLKLKYLSSTNVAKRLLPELGRNHADREIESEELRMLISKWIEEYKKENVSKMHTYRRGEFIYLIHVSDLYDGTRKRGYLLEISDDTAHQQHLEGIERYNKNLNEELKVKTELIKELRQQK